MGNYPAYSEKDSKKLAQKLATQLMSQKPCYHSVTKLSSAGQL